MPSYRIELELGEPLFCGAKHAVSNEMTSLEFIPGSSLRGGIAAELGFLGRADELGDWFGLGGPRWTAALPAASHSLIRDLEDENLLIVPMPLSFLREKSDEDAFEGEFGVVNALVCEPPRTYTEYQQRTGRTVKEAGPGQHQWTRVGEKWLAVSSGKPKAPFGPGRTASMHVGLHYGRQANRQQALFSRRELAPGTRLLAWVDDPGGELKDLPLKARIGKRRSAGNGHAVLRWKEGAFPWAGAGASEKPSALVQLVTDAIVQDQEGRYVQGLGDHAWKRILGVSAKAGAAFVATRHVRAWSNRWGLPKEHMLAMTAGSVFRIESPEGGGSAWKTALERLAEQGLGKFRHEGYGFVSVNPPWLSQDFIAPKRSNQKAEERRKRRQPGPHPWPGLEGVDRERLLKVYDQAKEVQVNADKIGDLASFAARVDEPARVIAYLDQLANRANPRGWKEVGDAIRGHLEGLEDIRLVRFYLNAIETLHG